MAGCFRFWICLGRIVGGLWLFFVGGGFSEDLGRPSKGLLTSLWGCVRGFDRGVLDGFVWIGLFSLDLFRFVLGS